MAKIGIVYGSSTGKTEEAADMIQEALGGGEVLSVSQASKDKLNGFDILILGTSTWGAGDLQDDWESQKGLLSQVDWKGKAVAFYGLGDQESFSETFLDGLGELYLLVSPHNPKVVGAWPTDGYYFESSKALINGYFVGLALDDDNQADLSRERIERWVKDLKRDLGLN